MEFCPKCGAMIIQKKNKDGCARCNYTSKGKLKITSSEKIEEKKEQIEVVKKDVEAFPIVSEKCKKCGHEKAYFWTSQTRSGDEAETKFFKCVKCEHTWREYR